MLAGWLMKIQSLFGNPSSLSSGPSVTIILNVNVSVDGEDRHNKRFIDDMLGS